jgi:hypothetical protein
MSNGCQQLPDRSACPELEYRNWRHGGDCESVADPLPDLAAKRDDIAMVRLHRTPRRRPVDMLEEARSTESARIQRDETARHGLHCAWNGL